MESLTLYEKSCRGLYLEKYNKKHELVRTAEKFNKVWIVYEYINIKNISGEYTEEQFENIIRKQFFK